LPNARQHLVDQLGLRLARDQRAGRMPQQLGGDLVGRDQPAVGTPQDDAVADRAEHHRHLCRAPRNFLLCLDQRRDVGHHADMAAVRQRRGADIDRHAVRPLPPPHLRPADIERHLLAEDLLGLARAIFARLCPPADHRLKVIADPQLRAGHHLDVGAVEHADPPVGAINADAVRDAIQDRGQQCGASPRVAFRVDQHADIGDRHRPTAVRQRIRHQVDHLAVGANPPYRRRLRSIDRGLRGEECLALGAAELVTRAQQAEQLDEAQAAPKLIRRQAQQFREARIEQREAAGRRECSQPDAQRRQPGGHPHQRAFRLVARGDQRRRLDRADHVPAARQRLAHQVVAAAVVVAPAQPARARAIGGQDRGRLRLGIARAEHAAIGGLAHAVLQFHARRHAAGRQPDRGAIGRVGQHRHLVRVVDGDADRQRVQHCLRPRCARRDLVIRLEIDRRHVAPRTACNVVSAAVSSSTAVA
jgi:hypothetical protein